MQTPSAIRGEIVPLLTPLTGGGERLDEGALRAHVDWLIDKGVHGLMPCGTTGEAPLLTGEERRRILEVVVEATRHRVPVLAHVGAATTAETVALAQHARAVGAEAVSAVTPYYFRLSDEAIVAHYCRLAEAVPDLPVYLYNIPQCTGNHLTVAAAEAVVARCPNVLGVKDSSGDLQTLAAFLPLRGGGFQVACGSDRILLPALRLGARASVSGNANVCPEVLVDLFAAFWKGDADGAAHQQERLQRLLSVLRDGGNLALFKRALELRGLSGGAVRPPLPEAAPELVAMVRSELQGLGFAM